MPFQQSVKPSHRGLGGLSAFAVTIDKSTIAIISGIAYRDNFVS